MDILFTIMAFLLLVGIVVTVHEGGHFLTAILCKIKIIEFSIGFGPKVLSKKITLNGDKIQFTLRLLPLGGFVKPLDQSTVSKEEWEAIPEETKQRSFLNSPRWKKALMVFGGPFSNFILAFFIYFIASTVVGNTGLPATIGELTKGGVFEKSGMKIGDTIKSINGNKVYFLNDAHGFIANAAISGDEINIVTTENKTHNIDFKNLNLLTLNDDIGSLVGMYFQGKLGTIVIDEILKNSSAEKADMKVGDTILAINDFESKDLNQILRKIKESDGEKITVKFQRNNEILFKEIYPEKQMVNGKINNFIGIKWEVPNTKTEIVHLGFVEGIENSLKKVVSSSWTTVVSIKKLVVGELSTKAISGPLSIADYSGRSAKHGIYTYLVMMAAISIAVGVFNLMPIPLLDGGHLMQYFIETVRRKEFTIAQLENIQYAGIATMTGLFVFAIINDINKYFSLF